MFVEKIIRSQTAQIMHEFNTCLLLEKSEASLSPQQLQNSKDSLAKVRIGSFTALALKIAQFVLNFFDKPSQSIQALFEADKLASRLIQNYTDLLADPNAQIDDAGFTYDVSVERLKNSLSKTDGKKLKITMVGVEYAGIKKHGGLAEAIEGLSRALFDAGHEIELIFPKYSHLAPDIEKKLTQPEKYKDSEGNPYLVYEAKVHGVCCKFIEHPSFKLDPQEPSIYSNDFSKLAERFASFSSLAADLILDQGDTDIVHLHDWHVAGVGLKLKKELACQTKKKKSPALVFTFHNNQRPMQGRLSAGAYSYDPVVHGYIKHGIIHRSENLFAETLLQADAITTVSEKFGKESQEVARGEGISCAVRQAARVGKLTGILNGANLDRWQPASDATLCKWKSIEDGSSLYLGYKEDDEDLMQQKALIRDQLQKWLHKFMPRVKFNCQKPIVTYIGRFDSKQKGIDRLEAAIEATLKNGGQFICMGTGEDERAKHTLDRLQSKYKDGVLFLRDRVTSSGKLFYQEGDSQRPGIGSLVRACTNFTFIPSRFEPCGLVQFEGWQFGSFAIGANTGGLADSISHGKNGFLFEDHPAETIREALSYWKSLSPQEQKSATQTLMTEVRRMGWAQAARKYEIVYQAALQKRDIKPLSTLESLKYRNLASAEDVHSPEEHYLSQFYLHQQDSAYLKALHKTLPQEIQLNVPSPHGQKVDFSLYQKLGSFPDGTFAVSAPHAKKVELVLTDGEETQTRSVFMKNEGGVWKAKVSDLPAGQKYQYRIDGQIKIDPYARQNTPVTKGGMTPYSVVTNSAHVWDDQDWIKERNQAAGTSKPMSIYELHLESWKRKDGQPLNYRELAQELIKYCKETGYTHVELMGILDHPDVRSWGYQVTGFFAPNSRMGSADDFKYLVDQLHQNKIGIILDFVPAHFASDSFGLDRFDGSPQYEAHGSSYSFSFRNWFFNYGAKHFDFKKKEVREFLISSAMYWIREMHIDGLRLDCVRSLLNSEDTDSAELFLADLNTIIHNHGQGAISIAEEFSGDLRVTRSPLLNGFDFDMKWHAGFGHLLLQYFKAAPQERKQAYHSLRDAIQCDNFHKQILTLSHDQANEFAELNQKIKDPVQRAAQMRAVLSFLMCLPGKKLHFMTAATANTDKWTDSVANSQPGWLDSHPQELKMTQMMSKLHKLYQKESAFYEFDENGKDLQWLEDANQHIHAYRRKNSKGQSFICMHNFTGEKAKVPVQYVREVFNSEDPNFEGRGAILDESIEIAPLSTIILQEFAQ